VLSLPPSLPSWIACPWIVSPLTDSHQCPLLPSLPLGLQTKQTPSRYLSLRVPSASVLQRSVYRYCRPLLTPFIDVLCTNRLAMLAIRANGDATAQVSSSSSSYLLHYAPVLTSYLKRRAVIGKCLASTFPLRSSISFYSNDMLRLPVILPPKIAPTQTLPADLSPRH
jgi:hypothetical protein